MTNYISIKRSGLLHHIYGVIVVFMFSAGVGYLVLNCINAVYETNFVTEIVETNYRPILLLSVYVGLFCVLFSKGGILHILYIKYFGYETYVYSNTKLNNYLYRYFTNTTLLLVILFSFTFNVHDTLTSVLAISFSYIGLVILTGMSCEVVEPEWFGREEIAFKAI